MNILFLDFDGVLVSSQSRLQASKDIASKDNPTESERKFLLELASTCYKGYPLSVLTHDLLGLDRGCIKHLNTILDASKASVVVSSSWRFSHNLTGLQKLLEFRGFTGRLVDITPTNLMDVSRGTEIQAWIDLNPEVERIVILDDNTDMDHLSRFLVKVNSKTGLTAKDARRAISIIITDLVRI
jgi:hypothetical protein